MQLSDMTVGIEAMPPFALLLLALGILALSARAFGGLATRLGQPALLGEVLAGVLLGSTVFGRLWPSAAHALFAHHGDRHGVLSQVTQIALVLFMLAVGMELDAGLVWRERRRSLAVGAAGLVVPFGAGLVCAWWGLAWFRGQAQSGDAQFCLFFATALSVSALPVIVKILGDLNLLGTRLAAIVISSAVIDDLAGWGLLGLALALGDPGQLGVARLLPAVVCAFLMLRLGPRVLTAIVGWSSGAQGAQLTIVLALAVLNAAVAEVVGLHAVFGSFLTGICIARAPALDAFTRRAIGTLGTQVCAPLFFATVALHVDLGREFDLPVALVVFLVASFAKVIGCLAAARLTGMDRRDSFAVAFSMNARGAMEIVFGQLAMERGLIDARLFVALVTMALATSAVACGVLRFVTLAPHSVELAKAPRPAAA